MIDWVQQDFEAWGRYMGGKAVQLDYPTESLEHRMMQYGPDSLVKECKKRPAADPYVPTDVERVERALLQMPDYERKIVIVAYTNHQRSRKKQAELLHQHYNIKISRTTFMAAIDGAHLWYAGFVCSQKKNYPNRLDPVRQKSI